MKECDFISYSGFIKIKAFEIRFLLDFCLTSFIFLNKLHYDFASFSLSLKITLYKIKYSWEIN